MVVDSITLFGLLEVKFKQFADLIPFLGDIDVSLSRISQYVELSERSLEPFPEVDPNSPAIEVQQASFRWSEEQEKPTLSSIHLSISPGRCM